MELDKYTTSECITMTSLVSIAVVLDPRETTSFPSLRYVDCSVIRTVTTKYTSLVWPIFVPSRMLWHLFMELRISLLMPPSDSGLSDFDIHRLSLHAFQGR